VGVKNLESLLAYALCEVCSWELKVPQWTCQALPAAYQSADLAAADVQQGRDKKRMAGAIFLLTGA